MLYSTEEVQKDPWKNKPLRYSGISPKDPQESRNQPKIGEQESTQDSEVTELQWLSSGKWATREHTREREYPWHEVLTIWTRRPDDTQPSTLWANTHTSCTAFSRVVEKVNFTSDLRVLWFGHPWHTLL